MKMTLKEFVEIINKQKEFKVDKVGPDNEAKALADVFSFFKDKKEEELKSIIINNDSKDNYIVCAKIILNAKNNNGKYKYQQEDDNLFAEVDIFKPYMDAEKKILNQKWHVLIGCLAFLDISSFDEECKKDERLSNFNVGKITGIVVNEKNLSIYHEKKVKGRKVKSYSSLGMNEFIKKAVYNGL